MRRNVCKNYMSKTKMKKDILFYSNFCDFSKEVVTLITKKNLKSFILLVCVDTGKYQIPPCIDRVPSLLTAERDALYVEDNLVKYIEKRAKDLFQEDESIQTFSWEGNNYSESFSFVNDDAAGNMTNMSFSLISDELESRNGKFKDDDDVLKANKFDIAAYDSYISSRNRDEEQIKKSLKGVNTYDRI